MKIIKLFVCAALLMTFLASCANSPSEDVVKEALLFAAVGSSYKFALQNGEISMNDLEFKVTNNYTREIGGETFYIYDGTVRFIKGGITKIPLAYVVGLVKRGNSWYFEKIK